MINAIFFGVLLGIVHYFSEHICKLCKGHNNKLISFSAGISITYIILHLFPDFVEGVLLINKNLFFSVLVGFSIFHLIEKYMYQHSSYKKLKEEMFVEHIITSFVYHFIVGIILAYFNAQSFTQGLLFFIPILLYTMASTLPVMPPSRESIKILLASSAIFGVLCAQLVPISIPSFFAIIGFLIGALLYTVIRHSIPSGRQGRPWFFLLGVVLYSIIIILSGV